MPALLAVHFDWRGRPNRWAGLASVPTLLLIELVLYAGLSLLERFPEKFSHTVPRTRENAAPVYGSARRMLLAIEVRPVG